MPTPTIFISYSHKDESWKDRLRPHLKVLEQLDRIKIWDDRQIDTGAEWYDKIKQAMAEAAVSICLISADYLASDFCVKEEIPYLLERRKNDGMTLIPVLLRACAWKAVPWLKPIQMLPRDGKTVAKDFKDNWDEVFAEVAENVFAIIDAQDAQKVITRGSTAKAARLTLGPPAQPQPRFAPPEKIDLTRLPVTGTELFGRENDLNQLDEIWESQNVNVMSLVAWGGVGKSTLINKWLERLAADNYRGARRVYGWSFYSQGTGERVASADQFIAAALAWFGDPDPTKGSPWDKGERLADLVRQQKTLLILDGMEPLQSDLAFEHGKIKEPGLAVLVTDLARKNNGLCVITTREPVADLQEAGAAALQKNLEQISPQAGRALLRVEGVQGTDAELEKATTDFGNHALAINLLAAYLHDIPGHHISHSREIPDLEIPEAKGRHPRRVMAAFEQRWGESPALQALRILGLFDRPAEVAAVEAVRQAPTIAGLTDQLQNLTEGQWLEVLENLRQHKLLAPRSRHNRDILDCHPLVREHFGEKLKAGNAAAWKEAHSRLYEYYKVLSKKELPDTLEEMGPLYAAIAHGCQAGRHREALNAVYIPRIRRDNSDFSVHYLGAFSTDLAALSGFFDLLWNQPANTLTESEKALIMNLVSYRLRGIGRVNESIEPLKVALETQLALSIWTEAAWDAGLLGHIYLSTGNLNSAEVYARQSVLLADRSDDIFKQMSLRAMLANLFIQYGLLHESATLLRHAEEMQRYIDAEHPLLSSFQGFIYCELLLSQGKNKDVQQRACQTIDWMEQQNWLLDIALDHLSLGRAYMQQALDEKRGSFETRTFTTAETHLYRAIDGLRKAGDQEFISIGLLARTELHRVRRDFAKAQRDLDEAFTIATRGGMRLHEADCHLEYARLHLAMSEKDKVRESWAKAKKMIEEIGYHRRDPEIHLIEAQLAFASGEKGTTRESLIKAKELIDEMGMHRWDFEVKEIEEQLSR